jgi:hypothetical protein
VGGRASLPHSTCHVAKSKILFTSTPHPQRQLSAFCSHLYWITKSRQTVLEGLQELNLCLKSWILVQKFRRDPSSKEPEKYISTVYIRQLGAITTEKLQLQKFVSCWMELRWYIDTQVYREIKEQSISISFQKNAESCKSSSRHSTMESDSLHSTTVMAWKDDPMNCTLSWTCDAASWFLLGGWQQGQFGDSLCSSPQAAKTKKNKILNH